MAVDLRSCVFLDSLQPQRTLHASAGNRCVQRLIAAPGDAVLAAMRRRISAGIEINLKCTARSPAAALSRAKSFVRVERDIRCSLSNRHGGHGQHGPGRQEDQGVIHAELVA